MISIEECKKYIGNLNLTDKQIEEVIDLLYSFIEQALDYSINSSIVVLSKEKNKEKNSEKNSENHVKPK